MLVAVGSGVDVLVGNIVGVRVAVGVGEGELVAVGCGVEVLDGNMVGVRVAVAIGEPVAVGVAAAGRSLVKVCDQTGERVPTR